MNPSLSLVSTGPRDSCQSDYLSVTFKLPTEEATDELYSYVWDLSERVLPVGGMNEPSKGRYFEAVYTHKAGISLEITPWDSPRSTRGCALFTIPGGPLAALDASERRDLIIDLRSWPGFYRCTRWDPQITVVDPPATIEKVINDVNSGNLWPARFAQQQQWEKRDKDGLLVEPPTQYFGSTQSNVRLRIYDHGAKHDWQVPSLRVEAQLRKEVADQHFRRLAERCYSERSADPLFVAQEERTVKDALAQHADLRDTSKWAGRSKPRKWAQSAPKPSWWEEMLQHSGEPLSVSQRAELDWDKTIDALVEQYGRKLFLWSTREAACQGKTSAEVMDDLRLRCASKLKKGDGQLVADQVPKGSKQAVKDSVRRAARQAALWEEGRIDDIGTVTPVGNTGVKVPPGADTEGV